MKSWLWNINGIFLALALAMTCGGCASKSKKKEKDEALLYFHIEAMPNGNPRYQPVPIYRANPQMVLIDTVALLNNSHIVEASLVDVEGGYGIRVVFDRHGRLVLENVSATHLHKRMVVQAVLPEVRYLAAPRISRRISDGTFVFTPDATREEAERIVKGVNAVAEKVRKGGAFR